MANSNRVFVSPGVYTSEKDLTFVAQSVGVTTLGLVGETLKGPAFEPILIGNYDEFKTYFGTTSPVKDGAGNPKYELPYVAKSYLQESNQLFVTRILGKTGYKPGITFGIKTLGGFQPTSGTWDLSLSGSTTGITMDPTPFATFTGSTIYNELNTKTSIDGDSVAHYVYKNFSGTTGNNGTWFVIGQIPDADLPVGSEVVSPMTGELYVNSNYNQNWYNTYNNGSNLVYSYLFVWNGSTNMFAVKKYQYHANLVNDNVLVGALRSRGRYVNTDNLTLEVTTSDCVTISGANLSTNPLSEFTLNVTGATNTKSYTCSLSTSSSKYIAKVLGTDVFDKGYADFPIYAYELYPNFLKSAFEQGTVRGIDLTLETRDEDNNFAKKWDTAMSPMVVSEVRGGTVHDLFNVITISDGDSSNQDVKVQIQNINIDSGEFDLIVRDFNDSDDNVVVLEKFTRCTMDSSLPGYVARKVGTSDGEYTLNSKYIMLFMAENAPTDAFPAGFKGYTTSNFGGNDLGAVIYKTQYFDAGETLYYDTTGTPVTSNGDKVKKVSLGLSSQEGFTYDSDLFKYKSDTDNGLTYGFHLSTNADTSIYQTTPYDLEGTNKGKLDSINYRKFTFAVCGGFDGWDIYRDVRTYGDGFIFGKPHYTNNNTDNNGVFSKQSPNSDYYAYLEGIQTYANPEAVDINVFATPGINYFDHSSLTNQAIDMVENERADSLYIISSPNVDDAQSAVDNLDSVALDTNYSATYWPWIQVRDTDNATQLFIPPTGEVVKNIALTDNVSYPWFAVAGYSRGLVNAIKAKKKLTLDERDELYKNRINPIATFSDTGTIIWGNKTLQVRESALDRINVRRLLLRARKLISAIAVRLLFEQNDDQVRQEFLRLVNPILESIKKERGLYEFKVTVSNDPEDIDANTLRGKIYVKPTRSLEFIDLEFVITPTGASFENI